MINKNEAHGMREVAAKNNFMSSRKKPTYLNTEFSKKKLCVFFNSLQPIPRRHIAARNFQRNANVQSLQ